jgi:predicted RNA-binding protein YlxR (DUF448 family)
VRLVVDGRGHLVCDVLKRATGRGVYLCPSRSCFESAARRSVFARGLRRRVATVDPRALSAATLGELQHAIQSLTERALCDGRARAGRADGGRETWLAGAPDGGAGVVVTEEKLRRRLDALVDQVRLLEAVT